MFSERILQNPKLTRLLLLVLLLFLWQLSDGRRLKEKKYRSQETSRNILCDNIEYACLDADGEIQHYICVKFWPKFNFRCEPNESQTELLTRCQEKVRHTVSVKETILRCFNY